MAKTICDVCAKRSFCVVKSEFYPVVKCGNYENTNDTITKVEQTNENTMRDWGVCKDCAIKDNCSHYKPCKRQCEDYEREPQTNFEQITKDEATLTDWLQEKMCFCTEIPCDECIAYKECWHQGNDTDYSNADLWNEWLKQPHTIKE